MTRTASLSGERMPLPPVHTAVLLHHRPQGGPPASRASRRDDILFVYPGIIEGEELHSRVDYLLEEHAVAYGDEGAAGGEIETEIILYWMYEDGTWSYDTYLSRICSDAFSPPKASGGNLSS